MGGVAVLEVAAGSGVAPLERRQTGPAFADKLVRLLARRRDLDGLGLNADALRLPAPTLIRRRPLDLPEPVKEAHAGAESPASRWQFPQIIACSYPI